MHADVVFGNTRFTSAKASRTPDLTPWCTTETRGDKSDRLPSSHGTDNRKLTVSDLTNSSDWLLE